MGSPNGLNAVTECGQVIVQRLDYLGNRRVMGEGDGGEGDGERVMGERAYVATVWLTNYVGVSMGYHKL